MKITVSVETKKLFRRKIKKSITVEIRDTLGMLPYPVEEEKIQRDIKQTISSILETVT
jgi:hypothetical protein